MSTNKGTTKAARTAERKRLRNRLVRRTVKTATIKAGASIAAGEESAHQKAMLAVSKIDKAVGKGVIHRNKGARLKSRLTKKLSKK